MCGAVPSLPHFFRAWCLIRHGISLYGMVIKYKDNFTFIIGKWTVREEVVCFKIYSCIEGMKKITEEPYS
jgi:hypothetical protein